MRLALRTALPMNRLGYYFLILFSLSAQVDDARGLAHLLPSAPLADDNDDYLPLQGQTQGEESPGSKKPVFNGLKPKTAHLSMLRRRVPSEWKLIKPLAPPPLYVFMCLQI